MTAVAGDGAPIRSTNDDAPAIPALTALLIALVAFGTISVDIYRPSLPSAYAFYRPEIAIPLSANLRPSPSISGVVCKSPRSRPCAPCALGRKAAIGGRGRGGRA
jgi:hypothetical protein